MSLSYQDLISLSQRDFCYSYQIDDFISPRHIKDCLDIWDELPVFQPASHARATRKDYLMHSKEDSRMRDLFLPKLQTLIPSKRFSVVGGNFTEWHEPVKIHTDGYQFRYQGLDSVVHDRESLGLAVLVPLRTNTGQGRPKTVFFQQTCFGEEKAPGTVKSGLGIDNYTNQDFDFSTIDSKVLSHIPKDMLRGFSIDKILHWHPGSAIIWHRAQFHCAGQFDGYTSKSHLVFFLNYLI